MSANTITFQCPDCGGSLSVPKELMGVTGPCPYCKASITSPQSSEPPKSTTEQENSPSVKKAKSIELPSLSKLQAEQEQEEKQTRKRGRIGPTGRPNWAASPKADQNSKPSETIPLPSADKESADKESPSPLEAKKPAFKSSNNTWERPASKQKEEAPAPSPIEKKELRPASHSSGFTTREPTRGGQRKLGAWLFYGAVAMLLFGALYLFSRLFLFGGDSDDTIAKTAPETTGPTAETSASNSSGPTDSPPPPSPTGGPPTIMAASTVDAAEQNGTGPNSSNNSNAPSAGNPSSTLGNLDLPTDLAANPPSDRSSSSEDLASGSTQPLVALPVLPNPPRPEDISSNSTPSTGLAAGGTELEPSPSEGSEPTAADPPPPTVIRAAIPIEPTDAAPIETPAPTPLPVPDEKASSNPSATGGVGSSEDDQKTNWEALLARPLPVAASAPFSALIAFLETKTPSETAEFVTGMAVSEDQVSSFYTKHEGKPLFTPTGIDLGSMGTDEDTGKKIAVFSILISEPNLPSYFPICVRETKAGWKVDWHPFVEFRDSLLKDYINGWSDEPGTFHLVLTRKHYFGDDKPDGDYLSFEARQPTPDPPTMVFLAKNTDQAREIEKRGLGKWNTGFYAVVNLKWRKDRVATEFIELLSIQKYGW